MLKKILHDCKEQVVNVITALVLLGHRLRTDLILHPKNSFADIFRVVKVLGFFLSRKSLELLAKLYIFACPILCVIWLFIN